MTPDEWLTPGRKTITGYLVAVRGPRKRDYGLLGNLLVEELEQAGQAVIPRYRDLHAVWFGWDPTARPRHEAQGPLLRYRRTQPIPGLRTECYGHRVEVTCTIGEPFSNGLGAYITRADGRCLTCAEANEAAFSDPRKGSVDRGAPRQ